MSITRCSKEEDPICLDDDEIDEILEDAFLGYITFSYDYTVKNFKNPGKLTGKTYQSFITPDTYSKF